MRRKYISLQTHFYRQIHHFLAETVVDLRQKISSLLKIVVPTVILVWLFSRVQRDNPEAFSILNSTDKDWNLLFLSVSVVLAAVMVSFVRWHLLLTTIGVPIKLRDTLRLGFLGYFMSFVAPGQVGGDLFKAVFVAREYRGNRTTAIATILIDRVCGVYGLLVVASAGFYFSRFSELSTKLRLISNSTYLLTTVATFGVVFVMIPGIADGRLARLSTKIVFVGGICEKLLAALGMYQKKKHVLFIIGLLSIAVHLLLAIAVFLAAKGLYVGIPSLFVHLVISPVAGLVGCLPISPGGLGSYEMAMTYLYNILSSPTQQGRGFVIGLCYRITTLLVAGIGLIFYWTHKGEVTLAMDDVKDTIAV